VANARVTLQANYMGFDARYPDVVGVSVVFRPGADIDALTTRNPFLLSQVHVIPDGLHIFMVKQLLQRERITTTHEIARGEGMTEQVWMNAPSGY
jgi:hypothetical protein